MAMRIDRRIFSIRYAAFMLARGGRTRDESAPPPDEETWRILMDDGRVLTTDEGDHVIREDAPDSETYRITDDGGDAIQTDEGDNIIREDAP